MKATAQLPLPYTEPQAFPEVSRPSRVLVFKGRFEFQLPQNFTRMKRRELYKHPYSSGLRCSDGFTDGNGSFINFYLTDSIMSAKDNGMAIWKLAEKLQSRFAERQMLSSGYIIRSEKEIFFKELIVKENENQYAYITLVFLEYNEKILHCIYKTSISNIDQWKKPEYSLTKAIARK